MLRLPSVGPILKMMTLIVVMVTLVRVMLVMLVDENNRIKLTNIDGAT